MKLRTLLLASALALGTPVIGGSVLAFADNASTAAPGADHPGRPSAAVMQHLADGRIAFIETALNLSNDQQKLWQPVADLLRQESAARAAMWQNHKPGDQKPRGEHDLSDMLSHQAKTMMDRAANDEKLAAALKSLEASLSAEQKQTLKIAFFTSMPHMMHHRGFGPGHDEGKMPGADPVDNGTQPG